MRAFDHFLRRRRIAQAVPWVRNGDRLLDVGCFDDALLRRVTERVAAATGIDPVAVPNECGRLRVVRGHFPEVGRFEPESFDCITALAVLEHVRNGEDFARECYRLLAEGGRVVLTVPHPAVDRIVELLQRMRILDGMDFDEHHGFDVNSTIPLFRAAGFALDRRRRFQLGLNHLFVFEKPSAAA